VRFVTYADALEASTVRLRGRRPGRGWRAADSGVLALRALELAARRSGVAFREPTWFVDVDDRAFDVIHQHLFTVRALRGRLPVVATSGYPLLELYRWREGWSERRVRRAERLELAWCRASGADDPHFRISSRAAVIGGYSAAYVGWLRARNRPGADCRIIGTGLPAAADAPRRRRSAGEPVRLLFVGRDFERKGGDVAMAACERLRADGRDVSLTVVTGRAAVPPGVAAPGVQWRVDLPRDEVVSSVMPEHDLLVAPTRSDCGVPYAVLEAMRAGLAVALSDLPWLDDRLEAPGVMRSAPRAEAVADALAALVADDAALERAQRSAFDQWQRRFTMDALGAALRSAYDDALAASS
jgi:glycosyltransferase involved in cell wall biosynthesis